MSVVEGQSLFKGVAHFYKHGGMMGWEQCKCVTRCLPLPHPSFLPPSFAVRGCKESGASQSLLSRHSLSQQRESQRTHAVLQHTHTLALRARDTEREREREREIEEEA